MTTAERLNKQAEDYAKGNRLVIAGRDSSKQIKGSRSTQSINAEVARLLTVEEQAVVVRYLTLLEGYSAASQDRNMADLNRQSNARVSTDLAAAPPVVAQAYKDGRITSCQLRDWRGYAGEPESYVRECIAWLRGR
jgi:hypothetical protein